MKIPRIEPLRDGVSRSLTTATIRADADDDGILDKNDQLEFEL